MKLYKANDLAQILNVDKQTIWKWGREGKLETVRIGRTVRFKMENKGEVR